MDILDEKKKQSNDIPSLGNTIKIRIRGLAGKFVDTLAIRKSNALLKKCFV